MDLTQAGEADLAGVVELANQAYRGQAGWTTEAQSIAGLRLTLEQLRHDLASNPWAHLLVDRGLSAGALVGTVWLEAVSPSVWYLGLLTVRPALQNEGRGRRLLAAAETFAREHGALRIRMTVVNVRETLIAWYERRGYKRTGETQLFPYGDQRFGQPLRDDLGFVVLEKAL